MSQNPAGDPRFNMRGAVDLSSLARPATPAPGSPGGLPAPGPWVVDVDTEGFPALVQSSTGHPVIVLLWASWSEASTALATTLGTLIGEYGGRLQLARIDADANPQVAAAFQSQSVPTVVAVLAGQPLPLFQGAPDAAQIKDVLDQVLQAAEANGITGSAPGGEGAPVTAPEPEEPPLPPLHQAAYDAIEADDFPAATAAYEQALRENPKDDLARAGLAQVGLLTRTRGVDLAAVRKAAADAPTDIDAQLAVADVDVLGGQIEDAFARLIDTIRTTFGPDRERLRTRLVDLFEVVGADDPRVQDARRALASALY